MYPKSCTYPLLGLDYARSRGYLAVEGGGIVSFILKFRFPAPQTFYK